MAAAISNLNTEHQGEEREKERIVAYMYFSFHPTKIWK
jgi:hypothetical protein